MNNELDTNRINRLNNLLTQSRINKMDIWAINAKIGETLHVVKESFNGSTKEFGDYLSKNCPLMDVKLVSYYIRLAGHNADNFSAADIIKWLKANEVQATNPRTCWDKFAKAHKPATDKDTEPGDVTETTLGPQDDPKRAILARLQSVYADLERFAVNLTDDELTEVKETASKAVAFVSTLIG